MMQSRVVLITGSGQGIGRGMAHHLGKHGATIVVAEWKAHRVERVVGQLHDLGVEAMGVECNILDRASIDAAVPYRVASDPQSLASIIGPPWKAVSISRLDRREGFISQRAARAFWWLIWPL